MLAQSHRVTAMIASLVIKSDSADKEIKGVFSKALFKYSVRYTAQEREREELSKEFTDNQIRHCFLKGTKVGRFYDNPDIRFMLDMNFCVEKDKIPKHKKFFSAEDMSKTPTVMIKIRHISKSLS